MPLPIFVGELNPYGGNPDYALFPYPQGSAGEILKSRIVRIPGGYYCELGRVNLCEGKWTLREARARAEELLLKRHLQPFGKRTVWGDESIPGVLVLLGSKVCSAFGVPFAPFDLRNGMVILPHPSGVNRMWSVENYSRAHDLLRVQFPDLYNPSLPYFKKETP